MKSKGKTNQAQHQRDAEAAWWWEYARVTASRLIHGLDLQTIDVWGTVLNTGEAVYLQSHVAAAVHRRGFGTNSTSSVVAVGPPSFVIGSAVGNARSRRAARRSEQLRWRDHRQCALLATTSGFRS